MKNYHTIGILFSQNKFEKIKELAKEYNVHIVTIDNLFNLLDSVINIKPNFLLIDIESKVDENILNSLEKFMSSKENIRLISKNDISDMCLSGYLKDEDYNKFFFDINTDLILSQNSKIDFDVTKISSILKDLGIPTKNLGFNYLKEAIVLSLSNNGNLQIRNYILPQIARKFNKNASSIERSLSRIIEDTYYLADVEKWVSILNAVSLREYKPTCKEFLALIVDKFISENKK